MPTKTSPLKPLARRLAPARRPDYVVDRGVSQGAELVGSLVVFLIIGLALDAWLGTLPVFVVGLTVFSMVGQFVKIYYTYSREMDRLEAERLRDAGGTRR